MKKLFILSLGFVTLFASCKKSNDNNTPHLHFNFDGTNKAFDNVLVATVQPTSTETTVGIYGATDITGTEALKITMYINGNNPPVKVGTYTDTTSNVQVGITYNPNTSGDNYTSGTYTYSDFISSGVKFDHTVIQITSVDATTIRGTFSAQMRFNNSYTVTKKLTSGDFYAKIQ